MRADGDSGAFILPQTFNNLRANELGASVDSRADCASSPATAPAGEGDGAGSPDRVSTRLTRTSTYDLSAFDPGLKYQLGARRARELPSQPGADARGVSDPAPPPCRAAPTCLMASRSPSRTRSPGPPGFSGWVRGSPRRRSQSARMAGRQRSLEPHRSGTGPLRARPRHRVPPAGGDSVQANPGGAAGAHQHRVVLPHAGRPVRAPQRTHGDRQHLRPQPGQFLQRQPDPAGSERDMTGALNYSSGCPARSAGPAETGPELAHLPADVGQDLPAAGGGAATCVVVSDVRRREVAAASTRTCCRP